MFERQRDPGFWTFDSVVQDFEFEYFDDSISKAIDGDDGGAYSLGNHLTIGGGPGVNFELDLYFISTDSAIFSGTDFECYTSEATFGTGPGTTFTVFSHTQLVGGATEIGTTGADALTVNSFASFNDIVTFDGATFFNDDADFQNADFHGVVIIGDSGADALTVNAFSQFNDVVAFSSQASFFGVAIFDGGALVRTPLTFANTGRIVQRQTTGANVDASYGPATTSHVIVQNGGISSERNYTIDDTGAQNGDRVRFTNMSTTHAITVMRPDGVTPIGTIQNSAGAYLALDAERVSGIWQSILFAILP